MQTIRDSSEGVLQNLQTATYRVEQCSALLYICLTAWCGLYFSVVFLVLGVMSPNSLGLVVCVGFLLHFLLGYLFALVVSFAFLSECYGTT